MKWTIYGLVGTWVIFIYGFGCDNDQGSGDGIQDTATETQTESDRETETDSETSPFPRPDESHTGWEDPGCWQADCHGGDPPYHAQGLEPVECVACHGKNGAPDTPNVNHAHTDGCLGCHVSHGEAGFSDPGDCETCHAVSK